MVKFCTWCDDEELRMIYSCFFWLGFCHVGSLRLISNGVSKGYMSSVLHVRGTLYRSRSFFSSLLEVSRSGDCRCLK